MHSNEIFSSRLEHELSTSLQINVQYVFMYNHITRKIAKQMDMYVCIYIHTHTHKHRDCQELCTKPLCKPCIRLICFNDPEKRALFHAPKVHLSNALHRSTTNCYIQIIRNWCCQLALLISIPGTAGWYASKILDQDPWPAEQLFSSNVLEHSSTLGSKSYFIYVHVY